MRPIIAEEARMGRKLDMMGRKVVDVLEKVDILQHEDLPLGANHESNERLVFTGPADWTPDQAEQYIDRKSTRLNSSHSQISYAVFCLKKKKKTIITT